MERDYKKQAIVQLYQSVIQSTRIFLDGDYDSLNQVEQNEDWKVLVIEYVRNDISELLIQCINEFGIPAHTENILKYGGKLLAIIDDNFLYTPFGTEAKMKWSFVYEQIIGELEKEFGGKIKVWVNVYSVTREFGGYEEGGWYYDHYECIQSHYVPYDMADNTVDGCEAYHGKGEGDISSVLGGHEIHVEIEDFEAESATTERPFYC